MCFSVLFSWVHAGVKRMVPCSHVCLRSTQKATCVGRVCKQTRDGGCHWPVCCQTLMRESERWRQDVQSVHTWIFQDSALLQAMKACQCRCTCSLCICSGFSKTTECFLAVLWENCSELDDRLMKQSKRKRSCVDVNVDGVRPALRCAELWRCGVLYTRYIDWCFSSAQLQAGEPVLICSPQPWIRDWTARSHGGSRIDQQISHFPGRARTQHNHKFCLPLWPTFSGSVPVRSRRSMVSNLLLEKDTTISRKKFFVFLLQEKKHLCDLVKPSAWFGPKGVLVRKTQTKLAEVLGGRSLWLCGRPSGNRFPWSTQFVWSVV